MFCPKCGARNDDGCQFCTNCGAQLNSQPGQAPAGYNYGGPQPNYGGVQGTGQNMGTGQAGQSPSGYGYGGPQPNYGGAQGAGQNMGAGPMGQGPAGYGYPGAQPVYAAPGTAQKKNMLPVIIGAAVVIVLIVVFMMNRGSSIVGDWSYTEDGYSMTMSFKSGGSGSISMGYETISIPVGYFEWETSGNNTLIMTMDGDTIVLEYSLSGNRLRLMDMDSYEMLTLTRK